MLGPNGVPSFRGDLKCSYDCDMEDIQIIDRTQQVYEAQEIANIAQQTKPEDIEISTKMAGIIAPPSKMDTIEIDLGTGDPSKMAIISAHLSNEQELMLTNFLRENKDIFAWNLTDMLVVLRELAEHKLDLNPGSKPIKQRL